MFVPLTPIRCLHRAVDLFGSKVGVVSGDQQFTYAQFGERCERLATALPKFGIEPGDRVAYLSFNNHQLLEGYYGVVQARAIVMPLNVRLVRTGADRDSESLGREDADVRKRFRAGGGEAAEELSGHPALGHARRKDCLRGFDLCGNRRRRKTERADVFTYDEMAVAELFYTSGSTGTPKGVTLAHRTLYLHALDVGCIYKDIETMVDLHTIPMFHANGWGRPQCFHHERNQAGNGAASSSRPWCSA
jgi:fatty-acyl-CoA synthase